MGRKTLGRCPKPCQRNFLEKVSLESSKTFNEMGGRDFLRWEVGVVGCMGRDLSWKI